MPIRRRLIVLPHEEDRKSVYDSMTELLSAPEPPDAVFCFNDDVALEVCKAIKDSGRQIGRDIGVIGYDNIGAAAACKPALSSVAYRSVEIGEKAAGILADRIHEKEPDSNFEYYLYQPEIVERESCPGPVISIQEGAL